MLQVREAEVLRCAALVNGDVDTVAKLLDPELRYVHSTGRQDTAASLLALLRTGATQYLALEHRIDRVRELGDIAVVQGAMEMGIRTGAWERSLNTLTTSMWRRRGSDWLLLDFQATVVPQTSDEFVCGECSIVRHRSQAAGTQDEATVCRDCLDL